MKVHNASSFTIAGYNHLPKLGLAVLLLAGCGVDVSSRPIGTDLPQGVPPAPAGGDADRIPVRRTHGDEASGAGNAILGPTVFAEADMAIGTILFHFDRDNVAMMFPVYRDFAHGLAADTKVVIAVPGRGDLSAARFVFQQAGFTPDRCEFLVCDRALTAWARDRLIALGSPGKRIYFRPLPGRIPDDYLGDLALAEVLARCQGGRVVTGIHLEGGNLLAGARHVFVGCNVLADNQLLGNEARIRHELHTLLGKEPLVLGSLASELPHEHLDMYMTVVDSNTVLLGDPVRGAEFVRHAQRLGVAGSIIPGFDVLSADLQTCYVGTFENIRAQLLAAGIRVERIPIVFGDDGAILTYNNALVERREDGRRAYVPRYGAAFLDVEAQRTFERLGCRAVPIDVSRIARLGGTVRCVTNVLDWRVPRPVAHR